MSSTQNSAIRSNITKVTSSKLNITQKSEKCRKVVGKHGDMTSHSSGNTAGVGPAVGDAIGECKLKQRDDFPFSNEENENDYSLATKNNDNENENYYENKNEEYNEKFRVDDTQMNENKAPHKIKVTFHNHEHHDSGDDIMSTNDGPEMQHVNSNAPLNEGHRVKVTFRNHGYHHRYHDNDDDVTSDSSSAGMDLKHGKGNSSKQIF